jgi:hypothetical protein
MANHALVDSEAKVRRLLEDAGYWSVRTWTGRLDHRMDPESFLAHHTGLGLAKRRFEALDEVARADCLARVRQRLAALDPDELVEREEIVFATGLKAGAGPSSNPGT